MKREIKSTLKTQSAFCILEGSSSPIKIKYKIKYYQGSFHYVIASEQNFSYGVSVLSMWQGYTEVDQYSRLTVAYKLFTLYPLLCWVPGVEEVKLVNLI